MMPFKLPSMVSSNSSSFAEKITEDPVTFKTAQSTVTCGYQTHITGFFRNVTVLWSKNLMTHSLIVMVSSLEGDINYTCKIDLIKPWQFWSKKGSKTLDLEGNQVEIYWDLRSARYSSGGSPEPVSDYYVAMVSADEVVLLLGDQKKKAYRKTKSRPAIIDACLYYKKENVFAKKSFATRARFDDRRKEYEIVVESSTKEPEMWISIDGIVMINVKNLQWKFRGNQTVNLDKTPVQVFWDVHDWLFASPGTGHGLFIFKPGGGWEESSDAEEGSGVGCSPPLSRYHSTSSDSGAPLHDFSLFLYAWKLE